MPVCALVCVCERLSICLLTGKRMTSVCACLPACQPARAVRARLRECSEWQMAKAKLASAGPETDPYLYRGLPLYLSTLLALQPALLFPLPSCLFPASQSRVTSHQSRTTKHFKCHLVHLTHTHTPLSCECACVCVLVDICRNHGR